MAENPNDFKNSMLYRKWMIHKPVSTLIPDKTYANAITAGKTPMPPKIPRPSVFPPKPIHKYGDPIPPKKSSGFEDVLKMIRDPATTVRDTSISEHNTRVRRDEKLKEMEDFDKHSFPNQHTQEPPPKIDPPKIVKTSDWASSLSRAAGFGLANTAVRLGTNLTTNAANGIAKKLSEAQRRSSVEKEVETNASSRIRDNIQQQATQRGFVSYK